MLIILISLNAGLITLNLGINRNFELFQTLSFEPWLYILSDSVLFGQDSAYCALTAAGVAIGLFMFPEGIEDHIRIVEYAGIDHLPELVLEDSQHVGYPDTLPGLESHHNSFESITVLKNVNVEQQ